MANKGGYVPPQYVPLYGLDTEEDRVPPVEENPINSAGILHNGLLASVLVLMIHRAVVLVRLAPVSFLERMRNSWDPELLLDHALHIEAPCGDLTTHLFCHLCAICQEYREIRERTDSSTSSPNVTPPPMQTMDEP